MIAARISRTHDIEGTVMAPTMESVLSEPTMRNLTSNFGKPPKKQNAFLQTLGTPHVDSFNYFAREGLYEIVKDLVPMNFALPSGDRISLWFENPHIDRPALPRSTKGVKDLRLWPSECRQSKISYKGCLSADLTVSVNGVKMTSIKRDLGDIPIMVKSDLCHLSNLSPAELVKRGEHEQEWGGYFIIKGLEKLIRLLVMTRRNYPVALKRNGWKMRGDNFTDTGIVIRCVSDDHTATTNVLHFVADGSASLMFSSSKSMYFAPIALVLKSLLDVTDEYIYRKLVAGYETDLYYKGCIIRMLRLLHEEGIHSHVEAKEFIGKTFKFKFPLLPEWATDCEVFDFIAQKCIAIHVTQPEDKFNILVLMCQKLFCVVQDKSCIEGADSIMMHENLVGGHIYQQLLKEKLQDALFMVRTAILKKATLKGPTYNLNLMDFNLMSKNAGPVSGPFDLFLATGNIRSRTGLGLMQESGLVIVAENINRMRYMSHFRAIHRGAFFQTMRTTEARILLPDAWGFICPVHTPDGAPCGLLNHLTKDCVITSAADPKVIKQLPKLLVTLGMAPLSLPPAQPLSDCAVVTLDGCVLGHVPFSDVANFAHCLRMLKVEGTEVPSTTEIVVVPRETNCGQFPGLFLFTTAARMMRPLTNLAAGKTELVGTFEQVYLDVCVTPEEAHEGVTTHMEISKTGFLSNLASLIPMPDCNQSPRNMYQCQMGKQTMGTPCHTWDKQSETKLYRLQTPATPLFRPVHYDHVKLDDFAMGTNAMVAVISYTGYDMEDAMIINRSSYERGFAHGSLFKTSVFEITPNSYFGLDPARPSLRETLDEDGLPRIGATVKYRNIICSYYDHETGKFNTEDSHSSEPMFVDTIKICGGETKKACITFRVKRNASVGDKFASRAGQKGICSHLWPVEDLPFTETGMVPDIVFNPHGFPSRMTIAMMIEIMAGKSAAVHGLVHDATPFKFSEKDTAIDFFGRMLEAGGYNYYGTEKMYSGTDGRELNVAIFFGVVHYQRLRHMVSDKWQVRSTGAVDIQTNQPVKGRRRGGGVRFGEMERDSLLSHGASFLLQDRLFHCSDKTTALLCRECGNLLSSYVIPMSATTPPLRWCMLCQEKGDVGEIEIPYIFRYLVNQMAAINIKVTIKIEDTD